MKTVLRLVVVLVALVVGFVCGSEYKTHAASQLRVYKMTPRTGGNAVVDATVGTDIVGFSCANNGRDSECFILSK